MKSKSIANSYKTTDALQSHSQCDICKSKKFHHSLSICPLILEGLNVSDTPIPPKALLTLPGLLVAEELENGNYAIKSKQIIYPGTTFGPLIAPGTPDPSVNPFCRFILKDSEEQLRYLDISDKNACNWMSLVRFAENGNVVSYQKDDGIYYTVTNEIQPDSELTVSYAREYRNFIRSSLTRTPKETKNNSINAEASLILVVPDEYVSNSNVQPNQPIQTKLKPNTIFIPTIENQIKTKILKKNSNRKPKTEKLKRIESTVTNKSKSVIRKIDSNPGSELKEIVEPKREQVLLKLPVERLSETQKRLGPIIALDKWRCKFCQLVFHRIPDIASHLTAHYKTVGAARTEKLRLSKQPKVLKTSYSESEPAAIKSESGNGMSHSLNDEVVPVYPYTCDICASSRVFNRAEYMIRHLRKHYIGEYFCQNCLKHYSTQDRLKEHVCYKLHSNESKSKATSAGFQLIEPVSEHRQSSTLNHEDQTTAHYICNFCHLKFSDEKNLANHLQACSKELKTVPLHSQDYKCGLCLLVFPTRSLFEAHLKTHDSATNCFLCNKSLKLGKFNNHSLICNELHHYASGTVKELKCPFCLESFQNLSSFHLHIPKHTHPLMCPSCHFQLESTDGLATHMCQMFPCDGCFEQFESFIDLRIHIRSKHPEAIYFCVDCSFPFVTKEGLNEHKVCELEAVPITITNNKPKKKKPKEGKYICEFCGVSYNKWNSIKTHRAIHEPRRYSCEICGKTFHRKEILNDHLFVHKPPEFECSHCGKKMKSKKSLEVHARIHSGIKRFKCDCGKAFTQKINLITHQMTHLPPEKKGVPCPHCGRKFSSKEYLSCHIEVHEIGKTHTCDICGKSFAKSYILMNHIRIQHGSKKYVCEFCQLVLKQKHSLLRHCTLRHSNVREIWEAEGYVKSRYINITDDNSTVQERNPNEDSSSAQHESSTPDQCSKNENMNVNYCENEEGQQMEVSTPSGQESEVRTVEIIGDCVQLEETENELNEAVQLGQSISFHTDGNILISNEPSSVMILQVEDGDEYVLTLAPNHGNFTEASQIQDVVLQHAEAIILDSESDVN